MTDDGHVLCHEPECRARLIPRDKLLAFPLHHHPSAAWAASEFSLGECWWVGDIFDFDNVSVSTPISGDNPTWRYLCCAECDKGPIGIANLSTPALILLDKSKVVCCNAINN